MHLQSFILHPSSFIIPPSFREKSENKVQIMLEMANFRDFEPIFCQLLNFCKLPSLKPFYSFQNPLNSIHVIFAMISIYSSLYMISPNLMFALPFSFTFYGMLGLHLRVSSLCFDSWNTHLFQIMY